MIAKMPESRTTAFTVRRKECREKSVEMFSKNSVIEGFLRIIMCNILPKGWLKFWMMLKLGYVLEVELNGDDSLIPKPIKKFDNENFEI